MSDLSLHAQSNISPRDTLKPKITQQYIKELMDSAQKQEAIFWGEELVVSYRFPTLNGLTVLGRGDCTNNIELARKDARHQVFNKLWAMQGDWQKVETNYHTLNH